MIRHTLPVALLFVLSGPATVFAQAPPAPPAPVAAPAPSYPNIRVGATLFADYTYTASPETSDADGNLYHPNAFTVARSYINVTGSLSPVVAFRFTPDIAQETGAGSSLNGSLTFRVKYAYLQTNFDKWLTAGTWARFGMQPTAFVNFSEDLYRYRFQGPIFVDREGFLSSSDAGAAFHYNLPSNHGDLHVGLYNGESYRRFEVNDQKALQLRGTVRPFPTGAPVWRGLRVTGFYHGDHYTKDADRTRAIGSVTYEHKYLNAAFDYLNATDQTSRSAPVVEASGYSIWATPKSPTGWEGLIRIDRLTPNQASRATKQRTILGAAYWLPLRGPVSTVLLLDYEQVIYDRAVPPRPDERRVALHVLVNF